MKSFKTHIVKWTATVMCLVYFISPLHNQIVSVLHSVSHHLSKPNFVLSHNHQFNHEITYHPVSSVLDHDHKLIDLIDNILDSKSNSDDSNIPSIEDIIFDKHFCVSKYNYTSNAFDENLINSNFYLEKLSDKYFKKIKIPPKILSSFQL